MIGFNIFQTAYVVSDIDETVARAARTFGIPRFAISRDVPIETSSGTALCHFALAFMGDSQIELIQPAGGSDGLYRDVLPREGGQRLHHLGCLIRDTTLWAKLLADLAAAHEAVAARGKFRTKWSISIWIVGTNSATTSNICGNYILDKAMPTPQPTADRPAQDIEITPLMIEAGVLVLLEQSALASELLVEEIFREMASAALAQRALCNES